MASGHYHRRWSGSSVSGGAAANLGGAYKSLSSAVEPSTHGTSWNSVRWNKPSAAYREHSSRLGSAFNSPKPSYSLSSSADRYSSRRPNDYKRPSLDNGPSSTASYANRRSSLQSTTSATPRYLAPTVRQPSRSSNPINSSNYTPSNSNRYESSKRYTSPSYGSSYIPTYNYNNPSNNYRSALAAALGKAERPWRQRMADSARQRAYNGDVTPSTRSSGRTTPRSRRSSASSGDELSTAVASLKNYADSAITTGGRYRKSTAGATVPTISENIALRSSDGNADDDKRLPTNAQRDYDLAKSFPPPIRTSPTLGSPHRSSPLAVSRSPSRDFSSPTPLTKKWSGVHDLHPKPSSLSSSRSSSRAVSPNEPSVTDRARDASPSNAAASFKHSEVAVAPLSPSEGGSLSQVAGKKAMEHDNSQEERTKAGGTEKHKKRRLRKRATLDKLSPSPANASGNQSSSDEESRADDEEARSHRRRPSKPRQRSRDPSVEEDASVAIAARTGKKTTTATIAPPTKLQRSFTDVDNGEDDVRTCLDDIEQTFVDTAHSLVNDIDKLVAEALENDENDLKRSTKSITAADAKKDEKSTSVSLSDISKQDVEKVVEKKDAKAAVDKTGKAVEKPKTIRVPLKSRRASVSKDQEKESGNVAKSSLNAANNNKNEDKPKTPQKVVDPAKKPIAKKGSDLDRAKGTDKGSVNKTPVVAKKEAKPLPPQEVNGNMTLNRPNSESHAEHIVVERIKDECVVSLREPSKPLVELFIDVSFQLIGEEEECNANRGMARASVTHRNLIREPCKRLAVEPPITALALVKKALVSPSASVRAEITIKVAPKVYAQLRTASSTNRVAAVTEILRRPNSMGRAEIVVRTPASSNKIGNLSKSGNSKSEPLATTRASFAAVAARKSAKSGGGQEGKTGKGGAAGDLPWRSAARAGAQAAVVDSSTLSKDDLAAVDELARAEALLSSLAAWERDQQRRRTLAPDQQQQRLNSIAVGAGRFAAPSTVPIADQRRLLPIVDHQPEDAQKNRIAAVREPVHQPKQQGQPVDKWRKPTGPSSPPESAVSTGTRKKRQPTNGAALSPPPTAGAPATFSNASTATDPPASPSFLLPAPVVRVLQPPRNKQRATITPSRQRLNSTDSQLSYASGTSSVAGSDKQPAFSKPLASLCEVDQNMLDLLTLGEQLSGSRSSLQTVRSEPTKFMPLITPAYKPTRAMLFESNDEPSAAHSHPMSPGQHQRKASIASTISNNSVFSTASSDFQDAEPSMNNLPRRTQSSRFPATAGARRGSGDSARTAPIGPPMARTERYAAHIPIRDQEGDIGYGNLTQLTPSRQPSMTSIDSFSTAATGRDDYGANASQLDAATKQVEQMINEAKYRHRQHRSKFKEAIDYLDQIYEDIRKECDQFPKEISTATQRTDRNVQNTNFNPHPQPPPIPPAPIVYVPSDQMSQLSEYEERMLVPPETMAQNRLSGDRLDFTRKWLDDDIKSWSNVNPKPDLLVPCDLPSMLDMDERSVGSASAEVAAINERDGKQSRRLHPHQAPDLIPRVEVVAKAAPVRRGSNQTQSSSDSARNLIGKAIEKTQQTKKLEAHRLSFPTNGNSRPRDPPTTVITKSGNVIQARSPPEKSHRPFEAYDYLPFQQQKAVSEDYYGRIVSDAAGVARGAGANNASSSRHPKSVGSVHSLPESGLIRPKAVRAVGQPRQSGQSLGTAKRYEQPPTALSDHLLTLDNLVAELDLNTDDMTSSMEMRQSFPTAGIHREEDMLALPEYNHPRRHEEQPMSNSYDRGVRMAQRQRTLDEATNLLNAVAGEYGTRSAGEVMSPYLDKNEELGGQRVDHMRSKFEPKNVERQQPAWRRNGVGASPKSTHRKPSIPFEDEGNYYEITDLLKPYSRSSVGDFSSITMSIASFTPSSPRSTHKARTDSYPSVPISSLPTRPPEKKHIFTLASSSQDLDYDDDGNYDNIPIGINSRVSQRSSPSRILEPVRQTTAANPNMSKSQAGAKLSQLLRKIGGGGSSSRLPQPASSMIALHKTSHEQSPHPALFKSNSVGYEPWAKDVLNASTGPTPPPGSLKKTGFGKRLKQSLFGSGKRK